MDLSIFSAQFFTTFWQLSLYDISVPTEHYKAAIQKHREAIAQSAQLSHREAAKAEAKAKDRIATIQAELEQHERDFDNTVARLKAEQKNWFRSSEYKGAWLPILSVLLTSLIIFFMTQLQIVLPSLVISFNTVYTLAVLCLKQMPFSAQSSWP